MLAWHDPTARRLAFREGTTPFGVLVSEIMAQQTQAERAASGWTAFMARFPDPATLAAAATADVIDAWQGLGYNRRAVNLQRAAQAIVADHDGRVPDDLQALLALPGVGPYTARAVLAFAFDHPVVPVDTNIARILARVTGRVLTRPAAQQLADDLATAPEQGSLPAALMDLGAAICTAKGPDCGICPLRDHCGWRGGPSPDPAARGAHKPTAQGRFEGSRRQARGRIIDALRRGAISTKTATELAGDHGPALLDGLVRDGLADTIPGGFALPGWSGDLAKGTLDVHDR